ncbi:CaiB/BaiF CoA transferase family protein [Microbulbifer hydrolyticus]|uniref:CoA transferase n=1 Tax=Microbulbifer hydrolyticus TaxID=48074 RepID=A0A6P1TC89_9GAMM|nr:CaiB/BaiF CoA-transferase family protein [Microbulbifer hydrolyticus]MBB5210137.1 crotonobetainyl-CoA:carnitine CoA-transferase CaiB-like acyl-CoA transferase [Microbulbifer hydrolyticus]QHQ39345.1 CoA transferase [Microbulbifer hydrolyticus]
MAHQEVLPLAGIKVVEFTHMVMGPAAGGILADLGAEVTKVEPFEGDNTRRLQGSGAGYFTMYNRNKRSLALDLKSPEGRDLALRLIDEADVVIENFRHGAMDRLGFGYAALRERNPGLIYCSLKGFLSGPYEHRTALDEVTQMMGGLAYMTGLPDRPLRAGTSVIDITGGMFGVIAILSALQQRHSTGHGQHVTSSLFETTAFLVGQHMAQQAVTGEEPPPMSVRRSAWSVYDIFHSAEGERVFVGVVSDTLWRAFCSEFQLSDFAEDASLASNAGRVAARERILPRINALFGSLPKEELMARLDRAGIPFAPINKPADLFTDPHLNAAGGLVEVTLENGQHAHLPALPVEFDGRRPGLRRDLPKAGQHSIEVARALGLSDAQIEALVEHGVLRGSRLEDPVH